METYFFPAITVDQKFEFFFPPRSPPRALRLIISRCETTRTRRAPRNSNDLKCFSRGQVFGGNLLMKFLCLSQVSCFSSFFGCFFFRVDEEEDEEEPERKPLQMDITQLSVSPSCLALQNRIFPSRMMATCNIIQQCLLVQSRISGFRAGRSERHTESEGKH
jgi:hypothetical protein